jgi:hypothetical protein
MGLIDLTALLPDYIHLIMVAIDPTLANSSSTKIITILKITRIHISLCISATRAIRVRLGDVLRFSFSSSRAN